MEPTTLIERLRLDHEHVLRDIAALERALARDARRAHGSKAGIGRVLGMLEVQFQTHMAAEDQVLYPAIARTIPASAASLEPLHDDHAELRQMLARLQATLREEPTAERDEQIAVQIHDLADLLRLHIRKEEALVFHVAARILDATDIAAVLNRMNAGSREPSGAKTNPTVQKGSHR